MKVKLKEIFQEWFKQTNLHLYQKGVTKRERDKETEEYVNDVLYEHMESMAKYNDNDNDNDNEEIS
jgi:hypothetical protein